MTDNEFEKWLADYLATFPNTQSWLSRLENSQALLAKWRRALRGVEYVAACAATDRIVAGRATPIEARHYEQTAFAIRSIAARIVDERRREESSRSLLAPRRKAGAFPAGRMYARIQELVKAGKPVPDAVEQVKQEFAQHPTESRDRYDCPDCLDTGLVDCWHPKSLQERHTPGYPLRTCVASCNCAAGVRRREVNTRPEPEFDESWMVRYHPGKSEAWNREQLEAFVPTDPRRDSTLDAWTSEAERHNQEQEQEGWV